MMHLLSARGALAVRLPLSLLLLSLAAPGAGLASPAESNAGCAWHATITGSGAPLAKVDALRDKIANRMALRAARQEKCLAAADDLVAAQAALAAAEAAAAQGASTAQKDKAADHSLAKAQKAVAKAQKRLAKFEAKVAKLHGKVVALTAKLDAIDPWTLAGPQRPLLPSPFAPSWSDVAPLRTVRIDFDPAASETQNGTALKNAIAALEPGDMLSVGPGTWSVPSYLGVTLQGTAQAPIRIAGREGEPAPIITRPDASQNTMNVGTGAPGSARFLLLRGLVIAGGSIGVRIHGAADLWIDRCEVRDTGDAGIAANSYDTERLFITHNHVHHTNGYGEGMYLGANGGAVKMRDSIVAWNHVHDTGGQQGDGIEIKQGSSGNHVAHNAIHDTNYPCLLLYGTTGETSNVVEGNVLNGSNDNVLQVQGEAIVFKNLVVGGARGFDSHDHQDQTRDLVFVHNTIVNTGRGAQLSHWTNRPGMVFANNVVYSRDEASVVFGGGGATGVTVAGNVVVGAAVGVSAGTIQGNGIEDFVAAAWDGSAVNVTPAPGAPMQGAGAPAYAVPNDLLGRAQSSPPTAGCVTAP